MVDNNGFFGLFPDIDMDGDHDIMDFLIMDGLLLEEEKEAENDDHDFFVEEDEDDLYEDNDEKNFYAEDNEE